MSANSLDFHHDPSKYLIHSHEERNNLIHKKGAVPHKARADISLPQSLKESEEGEKRDSIPAIGSTKALVDQELAVPEFKGKEEEKYTGKERETTLKAFAEKVKKVSGNYLQKKLESAEIASEYRKLRKGVDKFYTSLRDTKGKKLPTKEYKKDKLKDASKTNYRTSRDNGKYCYV